MNVKYSATGLILIVLVCCVNADVLTVIFMPSDGEYNQLSSWDQPGLPGQNSADGNYDRAVINNARTATTSSVPPLPTNAGQFFEITVGNGPTGGIFNIGHELPGLRTLRLATAGTDADGDVNQTSGDVFISDDLLIGQTTGAGNPTYTVSAGSLTIADELIIYGTGTLRVKGNNSVISVLDAMTVQSNGTVAFVLDVLGVIPVGVANSLTLNVDSRIVVDGSDYEALDGYFPLIKAGGISGSIDISNVTFIGLADRKPALVQQADGLWLRLTAPPAYSPVLCSLTPDSTVATNYTNTEFSASWDLQPTISAWTPTFHEAHVMDAQLSQEVLGGGADSDNLSWLLRVGRGGQLYSLRVPALGETVPPSYRSDFNSSPWNDEVWQGVAVDTVLNSISSYFIHQSGVYLLDPIQQEPFYSPQVAADMDFENHSFTTVNWGQHAHVAKYTDADPDNNWQSHLLYFTRYRDLGQGVIEVSLGFYNYGMDNLNHFNMPWGGVRRTSTEYAFLSTPGGVSWSAPVMDNFGVTVNFSQLGGWIGFSNSSTGSTPSLGVVFGRDSSPLLAYQTSTSLLKYGYTNQSYYSLIETTWRNYFVISVIRRYNLSQGRGVWARFYYILGDNLTDLSGQIAARGLVNKATMIPFDYSEADTPLVGYTFSGSGVDFRIAPNDERPKLWLYAHPVTKSFPIYEIIENTGFRYLTCDPYATGVIKTYDGTIAGIRLLGFALRHADINHEGTSYDYRLLSEVMSGVPGNYMAAGEILSVRTPPAAVLEADFDNSGSVDMTDFQLIVSDWLFNTPNPATWEFDMSTDPVGSYLYQLQLRDTVNTNYNITDVPGTLHVTGELLLDEKVPTGGQFGSSLNLKAKALSQTPMRLWLPVGMSSPADTQSWLGLSLYTDSGNTKQILELWTGNPPHIAPFNPVTVSGFAPNTMVDIAMNYDYDANTFAWSASDGNISPGGTDVAVTSWGAGNGGNFTIQGLDGTNAYIDYFKYEIRGSDWFSPYDLQPDGTVDLNDFSVLTNEWHYID